MKSYKKFFTVILSLMLSVLLCSSFPVYARNFDADWYAVENFSQRHHDYSPLHEKLALEILKVQDYSQMSGHEENFYFTLIEKGASAIEVYENQNASELELHYWITALKLLVYPCNHPVSSDSEIQKTLAKELYDANELLTNSDFLANHAKDTMALIEAIDHAMEVYYARPYTAFDDDIATDEETENAAKALRNAVQMILSDQTEFLYKDRFLQKLGMRQLVSYDELYYHRDENNEIDWALIKAWTDEIISPQDVYLIARRVIVAEHMNVPFSFGCGIYDVKKDQFINMPYVDIESYEGLEEAFNATSFGRLLGDMDLDNKITVVDATMIQQCLASIREFDDEVKKPVEVYSVPVRYYSDYDLDGNRTITDATHIQRYLASIE